MLRRSLGLVAVALLSVNVGMEQKARSQAMTTPAVHVERIPAFTVIGPFVRTTNAVEMSQSAQGKIGPLWGRFMGGQAEKIPGVIDTSTIYAVYSNYERDENAAYDLTLGKSVQPDERPPDTMRVLHIPAARYMVFPAADSTAVSVKKAWISVYQYFTEHSNRHRAFTYDFEQHSSAGCKILIAIR